MISNFGLIFIRNYLFNFFYQGLNRKRQICSEAFDWKNFDLVFMASENKKTDLWKKWYKYGFLSISELLCPCNYRLYFFHQILNPKHSTRRVFMLKSHWLWPLRWHSLSMRIPVLCFWLSHFLIIQLIFSITSV